MVTVAKIMSLSITIISLVFGIITFYIMSDLPKKQKKKQIDEITSQLINFIIFIWVSKIILNISIFIADPLAILAYPADSSAFYLAVLLSAMLLFYKSKRGQLDVLLFIKSFIPVFLAASLLYDFIQFVINGNIQSFRSMILPAILIILFVFYQGKLTTNRLITVILISWTIRSFILLIIQQYVTVFGYLMEPWFLIVFLVAGITINLLNQRKRDSNGRD